MSTVYEGILEGDRIRWTGPRPPDGRVRVQTSDPHPEPSLAAPHVDSLNEWLKRVRHSPPPLPEPREAGDPTEPLREIAARGGIASIPDPAAWQRHMREDRPMPGRE